MKRWFISFIFYGVLGITPFLIGRDTPQVLAEEGSGEDVLVEFTFYPNTLRLEVGKVADLFVLIRTEKDILVRYDVFFTTVNGKVDAQERESTSMLAGRVGIRQILGHVEVTGLQKGLVIVALSDIMVNGKPAKLQHEVFAFIHVFSRKNMDDEYSSEPLVMLW